MSESIGQRVFAIRRDLGDGWKNPMPQADFGTLLSRKSGRVYDSAMVSRMENGDRKISLDEVALIADLDPKKRGREWLAWGQTKAPTEEASAMDFIPDPVRDRPISAAEIARARAARDAEQAETTGTRTPKVRKATGGRKRG